VDVAKEAADFVLLKQDLAILRQGIDEGRVTFANRLSTSSRPSAPTSATCLAWLGLRCCCNFFLCSLRKSCSTISFPTSPYNIAGDNVDPEMVEKPRRWNTKFIRNYMVLFGLVSSVFDFLTFGALPVSVPRFAGGVPHRLVHRISDNRVGHRPGSANTPYLFPQPPRPTFAGEHSDLHWNYPHTSVPAVHLGVWFCPLPAPLMLTMIGLTILYVLATELTKKYFYSRMENANA